MKQKDIVLIVIVVIVSGAVSLVLSNLLFGPSKHTLTAETVEPITSQFAQPDTRYFNSNSIDPTQNITIGGSQNPQPFSNGSN